MKQKKKSVLEWIFEFANQHRWLYIGSISIAFLGVLFSIIPYFIIADIIKNLIANDNNWSTYFNEGIFMALCWLLRIICHNISTALSHQATFHVLANIRKQMCDKLFRLPLGYVKDASSGTLKNIMIERLDSIETTLAHILPEFTSNVAGPVIVFCYMLAINWIVALVSLIPLVIGLCCFAGMMAGYDENYKETISNTKTLNNTTIEYISGIEVIKAFGKTESSYEKFSAAAKNVANCYIKWMGKINVYYCICYEIMPCTLLTVLPTCGILYLKGSLSLSNLVMLCILCLGLITPLMTVMEYSDALARLKTIMGEITGLLTAPELVRPNKSKAEPKNFDIRLNHVSFGYKEKEILHNISLTMKSGMITALVGPSGSGKSTIAKLIASLWDVNKGTISVGGVNIKDLSLEDYNQYVAYVSQENYLFDKSILENIRLGRPSASDEEVINIAKKSGCHEFIEQLENGYHTVVGSAGGHLSGGECQRISIARAMLKDAPIIILDEATAYTDPENEAIIQNSVASLVQGKTLIVIAHRLSTIADADQIIVIHNGVVDSIGTQAQLLAQKGLYFEMWNAHISAKDSTQEEALA